MGPAGFFRSAATPAGSPPTPISFHDHPGDSVIVSGGGDVDAPALTPYRRPLTSRALRRQAWERDGGRCRDCPPEAPPHSYDALTWHADHVVELVDGGRDELDNLAVRCLPHHRDKTTLAARVRADYERALKEYLYAHIRAHAPLIGAHGVGTCQLCRHEYRVSGSGQIWGHKIPGTPDHCRGAFNYAAEVLPSWAP